LRVHKVPFRKLIRIKKNSEIPYIYDVDIALSKFLRKFHSLECHITLYPYSRKICSKDFTFNPFEEYVNDITTHHRSVYIKISDLFDNLFGLFLGLVISAFFYFYKPEELFSVQSIVSIIGAYLIGKDLWDDIEKILVDFTQNLKLCYYESYYRYKLEEKTTLTLYSNFAKKHRYGQDSWVPEKMDFISQSNSQTVRMWFNLRERRFEADGPAHILSIHLDPALLNDFETEGYLFGVKFSFNKRLLFIHRCIEIFQSLDTQKLGCLNPEGTWLPDSVFYRKTYVCGRIKYFHTHGLLPNEAMIVKL
jgi:hypothetical protein